MKHLKTSPFQIKSAYLTPDGRLLINHPAHGWVQTDAFGRHICTLEIEGGDMSPYLEECTPVQLLKRVYYVPRPRRTVHARWEYVTLTRTFEDYTNYDPDRCNNGGAYGYWENELLWVLPMRKRNGCTVLQFAAVRVSRTTADFPYTDSGEFQQQWRTWHASNVKGEFTFTDSGQGEIDAPLEEFPTFRRLTAIQAVEIFGVRGVSRALLKRGMFLSNSLCAAKRLGRRGRRVRG